MSTHSIPSIYMMYIDSMSIGYLYREYTTPLGNSYDIFKTSRVR